jgi:hypothetical protein
MREKGTHYSGPYTYTLLQFITTNVYCYNISIQHTLFKYLTDINFIFLNQKYEKISVLLRTKTLLLELLNTRVCLSLSHSLTHSLTQCKGTLLSSNSYQTNLCCDNVFVTQQKECALVASSYQLQWNIYFWRDRETNEHNRMTGAGKQ